MTDMTVRTPGQPITDDAGPRSLRPAERIEAALSRSLKRRHRAEARFKLFGLAAVGVATIAVVVLLGSIFARGYTAFWTHEIRLTVFVDPAQIDPDNSRDLETIRAGNFPGLIKSSIEGLFPDVQDRGDRRALNQLVSRGAGTELQKRVLADPNLIGKTIDIRVPLASNFDLILKGQIDRRLLESERVVSDQQIAWLDALEADDRIIGTVNTRFLTSGDSREPELAGIWGAVVGSFFAVSICLMVAFPIAVAAAVYLEEFARKNRWTDLIEVNINNLAAVPSIVFGLLGLAVLLGVFGLPRSAPLAGGLTLALMTLPTIIIAGRAALKAVPPSIREAARGLGASDVQTVSHHVLPLAMPGILTGTIIGIAQAIGETAPLLMIGMVAFVVDIPTSPVSAATALPVQVFLWADSPERGFVEKTAAAAMVLVMFLIAMNALAVLLRQRFERRW